MASWLCYAFMSIILDYKLFISTVRLLKLANKADTINADATYKLVWNGSPVLINGHTDMDKKFHPIGLAICKHERGEEFEFIFNAKS